MATSSTTSSPQSGQTTTPRAAEAEMLRAYRDRLLGEVGQIERELERLAR